MASTASSHVKPDQGKTLREANCDICHDIYTTPARDIHNSSTAPVFGRTENSQCKLKINVRCSVHQTSAISESSCVSNLMHLNTV